MSGPPRHTFPAGERWVPDKREVVFPVVLPDGDRIDGRLPVDVIQAAAGLGPDALPRDVLDAFRRLKRSVFVPAVERVLADGRIGDAGDGRRFVFIGGEDME